MLNISRVIFATGHKGALVLATNEKNVCSHGYVLLISPCPQGTSASSIEM